MIIYMAQCFSSGVALGSGAAIISTEMKKKPEKREYSTVALGAFIMVVGTISAVGSIAVKIREIQQSAT